MNTPPRLGALVEPDGVRFRVWAPAAERVDVVLGERSVPLDATGDGYHEAFVGGAAAGDRYRLALDGGDPFPDPASRFQPEGVHGPSEVVDPGAFAWTDDSWTPPGLESLVVYELHVGTFTAEGTFDGVRERLGALRELGVTAVELMPLADFPGERGWGYDGAALYAPAHAYGRPDDLRRLVDAAHAEGLAVLLDVVYNHLGPDGAYVAAFGPVFTPRHETPWGQAMNLDDDGSRGVRDLFLDNARHWLEEYHLDGFRLDATHALVDDSDPHFLAELSAFVDGLTPPRLLIAEDHRNDARLVTPRPAGYGLDAVWADDLHHQVRNVLAGDTEGYYADFAGTTTAEIAETLRRGWFYDGRPTRRTGERRGTSAEGVRREQCVVCVQNHDQVGNRPTGARLHHEVSAAAFRAATALLLVAPETPLLFMGQEWATSAPFPFFSDHNAELGPLVTAGRKREFADFPGFSGEVPDPQAEGTFRSAVLDWSERDAPGHAHTLALTRALLALRPALGDPAEATVEAAGDGALVLRRGGHVALVDLVGGAALGLPSGAHVVLSTESAAHAPDPAPPRREGGAVVFSRPGALVARV
ncbi:malto-oligosyltrehalose trehalohydrolase [Rubrivirga sp. S365]|uniref:Malto-oligosyltrehalose trehalohydrolase n=1 Tax=Rubrivirga litoralis TaxID=3075598 RepID=A0ABU3BVD3_9BACT|nr:MULTISPECIES: malto-oligosyltrehalose trehalohydrolase [unclassified Rubrivirga]MDT0633258.1 malto-oligosyltrehalose trehalohydrolase [Rubrivirga sp. F394]MDT7856463.1 malto-oligosyltrehalose trehalohydrolase [Rubrivirga sp. S365]